MASISALGLAQETRYVREATAASLKRRVADLVARGALDLAQIEALASEASAAAAAKNGLSPPSSSFGSSSSFFAAASSDIPTRVITSRPASETAFKHVPGTLPTARGGAAAADAWLLGTRVSLGRAKWVAPADVAPASSAEAAVARAATTAAATPSRPASIFSVADGRRLASEPVRHLTAFEAARAARVARCAAETPLVAGIRLMPVYTPGRALLWGTVLAAWATAAAVASSARALGVTRVEEAPEKLRACLAPAANAMRGAAEPWKGALAIGGRGGEGNGSSFAASVREEGSAVSVLSRRLKTKLSEAQ